jgi:hypothetical protein
MDDRKKHEPGDRVETAGDYVPVNADGDRNAGPISLAAGDTFPPLSGTDQSWVASGSRDE